MPLKIIYWIIATIISLIGAIIVLDNNFQFAGSTNSITGQGNACIEVRLGIHIAETCYQTSNDNTSTYLSVMGFSSGFLLFLMNLLLAYVLYRLLLLVRLPK